LAPIPANNPLRLIPVLLLTVLLFAAPGWAGPAPARFLSSAQWQAEIHWAFPAEVALREKQIDRLFRETLTGRLRSARIQPTLRKEITADGDLSYTLLLAGAEGREQFREALFYVADPTLPFTDGPTRLILEGGLRRGEGLPLRLETNLASGYLWEVEALEGTGTVRQEEMAFAARGDGLGVSGKQVIPLEARDDGAVIVRLRYRRPWVQDRRPEKILTLKADRLELIADLTDPRPAPALKEAALSGAAPLSAEPLLDLPVSFDWRGAGILTPVRDQGNCGSCWAFGTIGPFEANLKWKKGLNDGQADLSEEFLLSCNTEGYSCNGGWWVHGYHFNQTAPNQSQPGAVREADFPYLAAQTSCSRDYGHPYRITGWHYVGNDGSIPPAESLKNAIYTYGPVAVAVCAGPNMQSYRGGVFSVDEKNYCGGGVNHAVVLVGWNDSEGTWIMRNSWGADWGEGGYMHISRAVSNIGYAATYVTYSNPFTPSYWFYFPQILHGAVGPAPGLSLKNGDFESGPDGSWTESSTNGFGLITNQGGGLPVTPHSGSWAAWLGGADFELSLVSQRITIPAGAETLRFFYWIGSQETCHPSSPYDTAEVLLGGVSLHTYELCTGTNTDGWREQVIAIAGFQGQTLDLIFKTTTDVSINSNFFLDDVGITTSAGERLPVLSRGAP
jgi:inhibitor of cysteine peptidase